MEAHRESLIHSKIRDFQRDTGHTRHPNWQIIVVTMVVTMVKRLMIVTMAKTRATMTNQNSLKKKWIRRGLRQRVQELVSQHQTTKVIQNTTPHSPLYILSQRSISLSRKSGILVQASLVLKKTSRQMIGTNTTMRSLRSAMLAMSRKLKSQSWKGKTHGYTNSCRKREVIAKTTNLNLTKYSMTW